jgi:hypothetical protein
MEPGLCKQVLKLYNQGRTIRQIVELIDFEYGRESIRRELKRLNAQMRGRATTYQSVKDFPEQKICLFAELLGYIYGDGHLHKRKDSGVYECKLAFALNEKDLVERVIQITEKLFSFRPKVIKTEFNYIIRFRKSFAKYLSKLNYPVGKKSLINPKIPFEIFKDKNAIRYFIRGFLNAEASINRTVSVQQSVQVVMPDKIINSIKNIKSAYKMRKFFCYFISWGIAREYLCPSYTNCSNMLMDLKTALSKFDISSNVYPVRVYIGKNDSVSIHHELRIVSKDFKKVEKLKIVTCKKKLEKLHALMRG